MTPVAPSTSATTSATSKAKSSKTKTLNAKAAAVAKRPIAKLSRPKTALTTAPLKVATPSEDKPTELSIADLAKEFEITHRTIRFYEDQGLLAPERRGRGGLIRVYSAADRTRLRLTLRGKRLGFSLLEIKEILDMEMYQQPSGPSLQLKRFLETLTRHREALEQQLKDLNEQLKEMRGHESHCRELLKGKP
jgi:DNA-binding transcriptional MerR regulator